MKIHSSNYVNSFIEVSEDTKAVNGTPPPKKDHKTIAEMQFELISNSPYHYTSDDVLFQVFAERNELSNEELADARVQFFSKGQACFRASPLTKTYGFGIHSDADGKIALYGMETEEYQNFIANASIKKWKAMKSSKS
ncbi:DUF6157 family protein [Sphingobacterium sp. HJSM2_6]|uniref:DUF6157 family protein n=1 Tax=Sphingobacterium sp. HJSM2_6 TaxID=3366264 RepID=UPI003BC038D6